MWLGETGLGCLSLFFAAGCAEVLDIPDNPRLVLRAMTPWGCVDQAISRPVPTAATATVQVQACDFDDCQPVSKIQARVCDRYDGCADDAPYVDDVEGLLTVQVPLLPDRGFDGYLDITSDAAPCTSDVFGDAGQTLCGLLVCDPLQPELPCDVPVYTRALYYFNPPIVADTPMPLPLALVKSAGMTSLADDVGAVFDPTAGNLFITAVDCSGSPAAGVAYEVLENGDPLTPLYFEDGGIIPQSIATGSNGLGGFLGVTPGPTQVIGYVGAQAVGSIDVLVAPFTMTYSGLTPL
jgi:hypothetical protein